MYSIERYSHNYDEFWELLIILNDKEEANSRAQEEANVYYRGKTRVSLWVNGERVSTEYFNYNRD